MDRNIMSFISILTFCFLTGCNFAPYYVKPCTQVPLEWKSEEQIPQMQPTVDYWWEIFNDPCLDELEWQAIENSPTLQIAIQRLFEAKAISGLRKSDLYPHLNLKGIYVDEANLISASSLFPSSATAITSLIPPNYRIHEFIYEFAFQLDYELDVWGKFRNQYQASVYSVEAQVNALQSIWLSITTDLASHYFQLRAFDNIVDILLETIEIRKIALEVNEKRYAGTLINYTDVTRAEVLLHNAEADYYNTLKKRIIKENKIAALIGIPASDLKIPHNPLVEKPPKVPSGIPSDVLKRRPDILEAEQDIAKENALIGAARASFFPSLSLTGNLGYFSMDFKDFLTWKSRFWYMNGNYTLPIFDGFNKLSHLEQVSARFKIASYNYKEKVINAFQDVEDALVSLQMQKQELNSLEKSIDAAIVTKNLSQDRYEHGLVNYLEVADSERTRLETQSRAADVLGLYYVSTIQLIKAIGGNWDERGCENEYSQ